MDYFATNQVFSNELKAENQEHQEKLAQIFLASIPIDRKDYWAGKVLVYLGEEALRFAKGETQTCVVSTKAIHTDVGGNPNQEPSAWLSPIWKEIQERRLPEITPTLIQTCINTGLNVYPTVVKEIGKPAYYRLGSAPLPEESLQVFDHHLGTVSTTHSGVTYKRDLTLKLSILGRLLFSHNPSFTFGKRFSFLTGHVLLLCAVVCFDIFLLLLLGSKTQPLSAQDLVLMALGLYVPLVTYSYQRRALRLFEDRITIAPDWALSWKEVGGTIEINRPTVTGSPSKLAINRYTSLCPICNGMIKLDYGEPDYPRRIVGRCEEQPREHVFSFDRFTLIGERLGVGSWSK